MKLIVTDRASIEEGIIVRSSYAVISIRDPERSRAKIPRTAGLRDTLHVAFNDSEPADWRGIAVPDDVQLLTPRQAKRIWRFVQQVETEVGALVVHCHQGASRSPAVTAAIAKYLSADWQTYFDNFVPNAHVFAVMIATMPARPTTEETR